MCVGGGGHAPSCTRTHSSCTKLHADSHQRQRTTLVVCCRRRVQEREVAASRACVMRSWHMRARGPCSTRSNAATRLHMHRRLQYRHCEWPPGRTGRPRIKPKENGAPVSSCSGPVDLQFRLGIGLLGFQSRDSRFLSRFNPRSPIRPGTGIRVPIRRAGGFLVCRRRRTRYLAYRTCVTGCVRT